MLDRILRRFRRPGPPPAPDDYSHLAWLGPDENPFGLWVLDLRPFAATVTSATSDPAVAERFGQLRASTGVGHRGRHPADALAAGCHLTYPSGGGSRDGPLFVADRMEDKWDVYLYDGSLYFARSWTGELVYRAAVGFRGREAVVTAVKAVRARVYEDPVYAVRAVDFLIKSHVHGAEVPHPLVPGFPEDAKRVLAATSFGEFGQRAYFGSFGDTTAVRVPGGA